MPVTGWGVDQNDDHVFHRCFWCSMDFFQHLGGFVLIIDHLRTPQILAKVVVNRNPSPAATALGEHSNLFFNLNPKNSINEFKYHFGRIFGWMSLAIFDEFMFYP